MSVQFARAPWRVVWRPCWSRRISVLGTGGTRQTKAPGPLAPRLEKVRAALATLQRPLTAPRPTEPTQGQATALLAVTTDIIIVQDAAGVIRYASPSIERVLGYQPAELLGLPASALIQPDDAVLLEGTLAAVLAGAT